MVSILLVPFPRLWRPFQAHQLELVLSSPSCSTTFLILLPGLRTCLCFRFLWFSLSGPLVQLNPLYSKFSLSLPLSHSLSLSLSIYLSIYLLLLIITRSGLLTGIWWSVCISQYQRMLCIWVYWTDSGFCIYDLYKFQLLTQFPVDYLPTQSS